MTAAAPGFLRACGQTQRSFQRSRTTCLLARSLLQGNLCMKHRGRHAHAQRGTCPREGAGKEGSALKNRLSQIIFLQRAQGEPRSPAMHLPPPAATAATRLPPPAACACSPSTGLGKTLLVSEASLESKYCRLSSQPQVDLSPLPLSPARPCRRRHPD